MLVLVHIGQGIGPLAGESGGYIMIAQEERITVVGVEKILYPPFVGSL